MTQKKKNKRQKPTLTSPEEVHKAIEDMEGNPITTNFDINPTDRTYHKKQEEELDEEFKDRLLGRLAYWIKKTISGS